jgi:hypothetical protein
MMVGMVERYHGIIFTLGKIASYDAARHAEDYLHSPERIEPSDGKITAGIGMEDDRIEEFDYRPVVGLRSGKLFMVCPVEAGLWRKPEGGNFTERAITRIREYSGGSDNLVGVGLCGQYRREDVPPWRMVIPTRVIPSQTLKELGIMAGELYRPLQDRMSDICAGRGLDPVREKTYCVIDDSDEQTIGRDDDLVSLGFYAQEMESAGIIHQANERGARAGAMFVSSDLPGEVFSFVKKDGRYYIKYANCPQRTDPINSCIEIATEALLEL